MGDNKSFSDKMNDAGNSMMSCGCLLTLLVTIPILLLVLLSLYFDREIFIDVAIVYALLLFTDTLIMAKYFSN